MPVIIAIRNGNRRRSGSLNDKNEIASPFFNLRYIASIDGRNTDRKYIDGESRFTHEYMDFTVDKNRVI